MPISATGTWSDPASPVTPATAPARGFTLIEVMVVVVIVGIMLTFASLSLNVGTSPAETEAKRLAALARLAAEEAILTNTELALRLGRDGYRFQTLGENGWQDLEDDPTFRPRRFTVPLVLDGEIEGESLAFAGEQDPAVFFLSSGEVSAFRLGLAEDRPDAQAYWLEGRLDGEVRYLGREAREP